LVCPASEGGYHDQKNQQIQGIPDLTAFKALREILVKSGYLFLLMKCINTPTEPGTAITGSIQK
jgi:hypothetical protein